MGTIVESGCRNDLVAAHCEVIAAAARPGAWWSGAERIAIVNEVRRGLRHPDLPPWQAPSSIDGMLGEGHVLPDAAIDAVWRLTNHPGTLTAEWFNDITGRLPSVEHYVELVGLVAPFTAVERFASILGLDPMPLPSPQPGDPSREQVADTSVTTHWVPTTDVRGPNVGRALTGAAGAVDLWLILSQAQYVERDALLGDLNWNRGTLDRRQIELVAAKTSLVNECFY